MLGAFFQKFEFKFFLVSCFFSIFFGQPVDAIELSLNT